MAEGKSQEPSKGHSFPAPETKNFRPITRNEAEKLREVHSQWYGSFSEDEMLEYLKSREPDLYKELKDIAVRKNLESQEIEPPMYYSDWTKRYFGGIMGLTLEQAKGLLTRSEAFLDRWDALSHAEQVRRAKRIREINPGAWALEPRNKEGSPMDNPTDDDRVAGIAKLSEDQIEILDQHIESKGKELVLRDKQKLEAARLAAQQTSQEKPDVPAKENTGTEEPPKSKGRISGFFRRRSDPKG